MNERNKQAEASRAETLSPAVDVIEDAGGITLLADLPGVPKDGLKLHIEADQLRIEGEARLSLPEGMQWTHQEQPTLNYRRVFTLSKSSTKTAAVHG